jgi:hypothetical protein
MPKDVTTTTQGHCPACDFDPFVRNAYWTGKLMLARDFIDEQNYVIEKLRHHNQQLHGFGVACGLKVVQHDNPSCRSRYVIVEPGTAVDCCGHDIVVRHRDIVDLYAQPAIQALQAANDTGAHTLQICIRYRECPTEPIPVLYDDCADESRCAPNRILESYALGVIVDPASAASESPPAACSTIWTESIDGCPHCDLPDCLVLATIQDYTLGNALVDTAPATPPAGGDAVIDNILGRDILPSTQVIVDVVNCILGSGTMTNAPTPPPPAPAPPVAPAPPTPPAPPKLTGIQALSWLHGASTASPAVLAAITLTGAATNSVRRPGLVVQFTAPVKVNGAALTSALDAHVFEVLLSTQSTSTGLQLLSWASIVSQVIAVKVDTLAADGTITAATELPAGSTTADAVAFLWPAKAAVQQPSLRVRLCGDFVVDAQGNAVCGAFLRAALPTGQHQDATATGVEGGLFESWLTLQP